MENPLRLIELFAGYGSQALALKYLGIPFEHHFVCEFDKYAIQSYNDIHGTDFEVSDIKNISAEDLNITDTENYKYLLTYSFPCTDLSMAGKRKGMQRESGTSSSLLWEVERLLKECKELPQYLLMENVPQVIGKDNIKLFGEWTYFLTKLGYNNYYKLLNAKDFGVPQNRNRCFMVSILKSENKDFVFPKPKKLGKRLKDVLEDVVDDSYYLSDSVVERLILHKERNEINGNGFGFTIKLADCIANSLVIASGKSNSNYVATVQYNQSDSRRKIKCGDIAGTLISSDAPPQAVVIKNNTKTGYDFAEPGDGVDISSRMEYHRGTVQNGTSQTLKTSADVGVVCENYRIRKLTPKECFRLMGVKDEDYEKLTVSKTQKYKQAGNSIVVDVLMAIFENMFIKDCKSNKLF